MKTVQIGRLATWGISLLVLVSIVCTQAVYDVAAAPYEHDKLVSAVKLAEPALPSVTTLKLISLGNTNAAADLIWLDTIQYFGTGNPYGNYPSLGALLQRITDLDPQFQKPYEFALITLPYMKQTDAALALGLKAQKNIPNNGLLTFYLASLYHLNLKDYKNAAYYYHLASTEPGAPSSSSLLEGIARNQIADSINDRLVAAAFWETVYNNATNDTDRATAKGWYEHMQLVYSLELKAQQFKTAIGRYPLSLTEMVEKGYLNALPVSPIQRELILDPQTGRINFDHALTQN